MNKTLTFHYENECTLKCTDNGKEVEAVVDRFKTQEKLTVILEGKIRINLKYTKFNEYVGSMGGLEFVTKGPKYIGSSFR